MEITIRSQNRKGRMILYAVIRFPFLGHFLFWQDFFVKVGYRIPAYRTPLLIRTPWAPIWAYYGHFWQIFITIYSFSDKKCLKMTIVYFPKMLDFNRTPAFYMRRYGRYSQLLCNCASGTLRADGRRLSLLLMKSIRNMLSQVINWLR